jgi:hypothetical protein
MRHDTSPRFQLREDDRPKPHVDLREEVRRQDRRAGNVGDEEVLREKLGFVGHALALRLAPRVAHERAVELDAKPARPPLLRSRDDDAPVARAEIDHEILGAYPGDFEHGVDDVGWGGDVGDVGGLGGRRWER